MGKKGSVGESSDIGLEKLFYSHCHGDILFVSQSHSYIPLSLVLLPHVFRLVAQMTEDHGRVRSEFFRMEQDV